MNAHRVLRPCVFATALAAAMGVPVDLGDAGPLPDPITTGVVAAGDPRPVQWEHRYRVSGRVWIVFWIDRDDVGAARMTRRKEGVSDTISFLGGSDPRRAPNNLNQWGYAVEDATGPDVMVFVIRSIHSRDGQVPEAALAEGAEPGLFGASCTAIGPASSRASITGIRVPPTVTFRSFGRLVDALDGSTRWQTSDAPRPSGAFPGFFSAMMDSIDESVARAKTGTLMPAVTRRPYVFKGGLYDLTTRKVERVSAALLRARYTYRNRTTGDAADFTVTFGIDGELAGVPVEMVFRPSWWARIHLRLDDSADVPEDPSNDTGIYSHITRICSRVLAFRPTSDRLASE